MTQIRITVKNPNQITGTVVLIEDQDSNEGSLKVNDVIKFIEAGRPNHEIIKGSVHDADLEFVSQVNEFIAVGLKKVE